RLVQGLIDSLVAAGDEVTSGGAARTYEVGLVQKLPWLPELNGSARLRELASEIVDLRRQDDTEDETTRLFLAPAVLSHLVAGTGFVDAVQATMQERSARWASILRATLDAEHEMHCIAELDAD